MMRVACFANVQNATAAATTVSMIDTPAGLIPISYRQEGLGMDNTHVAYDDRGVITGFMPKAQADLARFCTHWARNLKDQQGL
jgi:hypothetical protein